MDGRNIGESGERDGDNGLPFWKRALDLGLIVLALPGWLIIGTFVALVVRVGSVGPVFFRQQRVGYKGKEFTLYKFRTMHINAVDDCHREHTRNLIKSAVPMEKLDSRKDSRLIAFGSFLRACGLDELPQLLNVMRGDMSLVGPRPCLRYEYDLYEPWHRRRLDAVPGLTGLWQVSGKNRTTFEEMVLLDIEYARRRSLWLDLKIIFKTLPALWGQYCDLRAARPGETAVETSGLAKSRESYNL